jgi:3-hydroxyacyl-[acyl-carrier-protein] dehydratase
VELDVSPELDVFRGHFPGSPIFPGVLQAEAGAQACLWVTLGELPEGAPLPEVYFVGIESYKFRRPVIPPATLSFRVKQNKVRAGLQLWEVEVKQGETLVSNGSFWLKMIHKHSS